MSDQKASDPNRFWPPSRAYVFALLCWLLAAYLAVEARWPTVIMFLIGSGLLAVLSHRMEGPFGLFTARGTRVGGELSRSQPPRIGGGYHPPFEQGEAPTESQPGPGASGSDWHLVWKRPSDAPRPELPPTQPEPPPQDKEPAGG